MSNDQTSKEQLADAKLEEAAVDAMALVVAATRPHPRDYCGYVFESANGPIWRIDRAGDRENYFRASAAYWRKQAQSAPEPKCEQIECNTDAARWRALIGCARVRVLGSAGIRYPGPTGYAHIGVEFWTHHSTPTDPTAIEDLMIFVERAAAVKKVD